MKKFILIPESKNTELAGNKPVPAKEVLPNWYKNMHPYANNDKKLRIPNGWDTHNATMKRCVPFLDAMTTGYTIKLDADILVEIVDNTPYMRWKIPEQIITWHTLNQFPGFQIPSDYHYMVAKWDNDFGYILPKGYSMFITHPINRIDLPFHTLSGIVDVDNFNMAIKFPFILKKNFEGIIEAGTPIAQIFPVKRDSWKMEEEDFNEEKTYVRNRKFRSIIHSAYKKQYWNKKEYN